jgi:hypothetical protein
MIQRKREVAVLLLLLSSCFSGSQDGSPCEVAKLDLSSEPLSVRTGLYEISATVRLKGCRGDLENLSASELGDLRTTMESIMTNQQILLFAIVRDDGLRKTRVVDPLNAVLPSSVIEDVEVKGGFAEFQPSFPLTNKESRTKDDETALGNPGRDGG